MKHLVIAVMLCGTVSTSLAQTLVEAVEEPLSECRHADTHALQAVRELGLIQRLLTGEVRKRGVQVLQGDSIETGGRHLAHRYTLQS